MAGQIVTLYVDSTNVRLLVTSGKRIRKWFDLPLDLGLTKVNPSIKEAELVARITQLFKSQKVAMNKVIIGVSGMLCLTRPITLPQVPRTMLTEAVTREARRVLPMPLEQLHLTWQIMPSREGEIRAFLVAIPCKTADTLLKILEKVGIKPYLMDIKPLALTRLVKESTAIIVDVQSTEFDIVIMSDGVPQPIRTVSFPDTVLSLPEKLNQVKNDLARTMEFYDSNNPEKMLKPEVNIYVSGELAEAPELCQSLAKELGHAVLLLTSPLKCPQNFNPARYMMNIGLALKEMPKEVGPSVATLNVLPVPYRPKPISMVRIAVLPTAAIAFCILVGLLVLLQSGSTSVQAMTDQLDNTNRMLQQRQLQKKEVTESIANLEQTIKSTQVSRDTFAYALNTLDRLGEIVNGDLGTMASSVIEDLRLAAISHDGSKLTIQGVSSSETEILSYARVLDDSGRFTEVTVANIRKEGGQMNFTLVLKAGGKQ